MKLLAILYVLWPLTTTLVALFVNEATHDFVSVSVVFIVMVFAPPLLLGIGYAIWKGSSLVWEAVMTSLDHVITG